MGQSRLYDLTAQEKEASKARAQAAGEAEYARLTGGRPDGLTSARVMAFVRRAAEFIRLLQTSVPYWVVFVILGSATISVDKMSAAFMAAAAHPDWGTILVIAGAAMTEFGLLYLAFANHNEHLQKHEATDGQKAITLALIVHAILVKIFGGLRVAKWRVPTQTHLPNLARPAATIILLALALAGNAYTVLYSESAAAPGDLPESNALLYFKLFFGLSAPLALWIFGEELARTMEMVGRQYTDESRREIIREWQEGFLEWWQEHRATREAEELSRAFRNKNSLPLEASTPYLQLPEVADAVPLSHPDSLTSFSSASGASATQVQEAELIEPS